MNKLLKNNYLFVETKSPWNNKEEVKDFINLASEIGRGGSHVDFFLIQDAVLMARESTENSDVNYINLLFELESVNIWVDDFSLAQRSLCYDDVWASIQLGSMSKLVNILTEDNCKPVWHS